MMRSEIDLAFHALGDPTRRAIFEVLARGGEQNVRTLTEVAGVSQPMVSRHLALLRDAGLVAERRTGREHHFSVRGQGLAPLANWVTQQGQFWSEKFDALEALLDRMDN